MADEVQKLKELSAEDVPADLQAETYFDFAAHPFEHQALFDQTKSVYDAILGIDDYAVKWLADTIEAKRAGAKCLESEALGACQTVGSFEVLVEEGATFAPLVIVGSTKEGVCNTVYVAKGANVVGVTLWLDKGSVYIGEGTTVEAGVGIKGPTIIGSDTEVRQGAYLRGDIIIGNGATIRGEIKNCCLMDKSNFPHPSYLGDSLCGYMTHFGNQATTANLGIFAGLVDNDKRKPLVIDCGDKRIDLGKPKMGVCMGDFSQVGCNSVTDPGSFLKPYTIAYTLCRISKGIYGPNEILKNKPIEHGVIERAEYRPMG